MLKQEISGIQKLEISIILALILVIFKSNNYIFRSASDCLEK